MVTIEVWEAGDGNDVFQPYGSFTVQEITAWAGGRITKLRGFYWERQQAEDAAQKIRAAMVDASDD